MASLAEAAAPDCAVRSAVDSRPARLDAEVDISVIEPKLLAQDGHGLKGRGAKQEMG